ncbi:MAG: hypothetical protein K4445_01430 [Deltaproteobacteria bacterium]|jgi:thioredoxin-like negative regulator of GroEL|nr:hypothetical protein [Syntrophaceae bacterium]
MSRVHWIRPQNFEEDVTAEKKMVLLLCMPRDDAFDEQLRVVEEIALQYADQLKVVLPEESCLAAFREDYAIAGTPTFLALIKGREVGRILGLADRETLKKFVDQALQSGAGAPQEGNDGP